MVEHSCRRPLVGAEPAPRPDIMPRGQKEHDEDQEDRRVQGHLCPRFAPIVSHVFLIGIGGAGDCRMHVDRRAVAPGRVPDRRDLPREQAGTFGLSLFGNQSQRGVAARDVGGNRGLVAQQISLARLERDLGRVDRLQRIVDLLPSLRRGLGGRRRVARGRPALAQLGQVVEPLLQLGRGPAQPRQPSAGSKLPPLPGAALAFAARWRRTGARSGL